MDILEEFIDDNLVSPQNILKCIDDYSIYSFYIQAELELNTKYSSPLRVDSDPSFSLYYSRYLDDVILWKDQSTNMYGNVFDFVRCMMGEGTTHRSVMLQINSDLGLGLEGLDTKEFKPAFIKTKPVKREPKELRITECTEPRKDFLDYWEFLGVSKEVRDYYKVSNPSVVHYKDSEGSYSTYPKGLAISYEILGSYKIYQPYETKLYKFRNNFKPEYVEGAMQLKFKKDFAIITKSTKEILFMYSHFGWECVAGKSETQLLSKHFMENILKGNYKHVFIWLDSDEAGLASQAKYLSLYPWLIPIEVCSTIEQKDPTDMYTAYKKVGREVEILNYIENLITIKL